MAATEQSSEPRRDYASPATWGDVESVRYRMETRIAVARIEAQREVAEREIRRLRWTVATMLVGVGAIGVLYGILEAVR